VRGQFGRMSLVCVMVLAFAAGKAGAVTLTAACSGTSGDVGSDSGSLVTEIGQANSVGGTNTIDLGAGCIYDLTVVNNNWYGPNGLPAISSALTIDGNGATIARDSTAAKFRLLFVGADPLNALTGGYTSPGPGQLTLRDVTLSDGWAQGGDSNGGGGGAGMGGAIFNQGTVTILDSTLTANKADGGSSLDPAAGPGGGGIGTNSLGDAGGGFGSGTFGGASGGPGSQDAGGGGGGGFRSTENGGAANCCPHSVGGAGGGPATGTGGEGGIPGGTPGPGGDGSGGGGTSFGIASNDTGGTFGQGGQGNGGGGAGGGVGGGGGSGTDNGGGGGFGGGGGLGGGGGNPFAGGGMGGFGGGGGAGNDLPGASGFGGGGSTTTVGGGGAGMGGAIFNMQGTVTITNSTLAADSASGGSGTIADPGKGFGGAVFNLSGSFTAVDSTFANDSADFDGSAIYNMVYDAAVARTAQTTLSGTIVATGGGPGPSLTNDKTTYITPAPNLGSANVDVSNSDLVESMNANTGSSPIVGTPLTADPLLGPLQDNGGPTQTMAPAGASPAIDAGSAHGQTTDQRGDPRPVDFPGIANPAGGDGADIGALEVQQTCGTEANPSEACNALSVTVAGTGSGSVSGAAGISCPGTCTGSFGASQTLVLTATPRSGSTFAGWSGACSGTNTCKVAMSTDRSVTATFTPTAISKPPSMSISLLKQSASVWRAGSKLAQISRKRKRSPVGTTFSFSLSERAAITLTFKRSAAGRRVRGDCVTQTRSNEHLPKCSLTIPAGSLTMSAGMGADKIYFDGLISRRERLGLGRYTLTIAAVDPAGRRAASRPLHFTIVK
jgi:hypothetical protein